MVNSAARRAEIHAVAVRLGGKQVYRIARRLVGQDVVPVRFHFVAVFWMKEKTLIAPAAFCAAVAGYFGLSVGEQTS